MTRRLDPMDRVRELGDASVPFRFDTHALYFCDDAVALENRLHTAFANSGSTRSTSAANSSAPPQPKYATPPGPSRRPATYSNSHETRRSPRMARQATQLLRYVQFAATLDLSSPNPGDSRSSRLILDSAD